MWELCNTFPLKCNIFKLPVRYICKSYDYRECGLTRLGSLFNSQGLPQGFTLRQLAHENCITDHIFVNPSLYSDRSKKPCHERERPCHVIAVSRTPIHSAACFITNGILILNHRDLYIRYYFIAFPQAKACAYQYQNPDPNFTFYFFNSAL